MIYYTGDTHGQPKKILDFIQRFKLTSDDVIVILGDAGFNYYENDRGDRRRKRQLNDTGVTIFCLHGNHERRPESLPYYHEDEWHGGIVFIENDFPNLLFAKDGEAFDFEGRQAVVIGGAYSVDKYYRLGRGIDWFEDEQPSEEIKKRVESKLEDIGWRTDIVLTHTCPAKYIPTEAFLSGIDESTVDRSTENWLDGIEDRLTYDHWLCGHWHIDKKIDKLHFLMHSFDVLYDNISGTLIQAAK